MSQFEEMMKSFQDYAELKEFAKAQHDTILQLTKKIEKLENEKQLGIVPVPTSTSTIIHTPIAVEYEENICRMELKKLNDMSLERHLTLEEAKKVDIYTKLLLQIQNRNKKSEREAEKVDTQNLLSIVDGGND